MTWIPIAKGSPEELQSNSSWLKELRPGMDGQVRVEGLPWGTAKVFDLPLAEQVFGSRLVPNGARVIDCHEENGIGYVDFQVTGTPVHIIIAAIALAVIALCGVICTITVCVKLSQLSPTMFAWWLWLIIIAIVAAVVIVTVLVARKGRIRAGPVQVGK